MPYSLERLTFHDGKEGVDPSEVVSLYEFAYWARSRRVEEVARMLQNTSMVFSVRDGGVLVAFARALTDFCFRASIWDFVVRPEYQGIGLGRRFMEYILGHPVIGRIPVVVMYMPEYRDFLAKFGFEERDGLMVLLRRPIEFS